MACVVCASVSAPGDVVDLVAPGSSWSYLDDGSDQGTDWREPAFDDVAWAVGPAQLGYGDGDEATVVSFGPNASSKHITTYFRTDFTVPDPSAFVAYTVHLLRDDGGVVYVNGQEVARANMPAGTITHVTRAASTIGGSDEDLFTAFAVPPSAIVPGLNVVAVEIHQRSPSSSDTSFDLRLTGSDGSPCVVRGPYLQQGTPNSVVVRWRTDIATDSTVRYGSAPGVVEEIITVPGARTEHEVALGSLSAETTYFYSVGSATELLAGGDDTTFVRTSPPAGAVRPVRMWAVGDSGTADAKAAGVRDAFVAYNGPNPLDLMLMLGDNAYDDGTDSEHQAAIFDMYPNVLRRTPVWPTLGNHDGRSADSDSGTGVYYDTFTLPKNGEAGGVPSGTEAYYSFDYANVHVVCLESYETDRSPNGAMMTWLRQDVSATTQDWIVAFWHHPPYSKGSHNSDSEGTLIDMRQSALPILEGAGVDLVLTGHSHSHERSFLVDGHYGHSSTLTPAMILDGGDGNESGDGAYAKPTPALAPHEGAVYIVAGSSGKLTSAALNHPVMYTSNLELGSLVIDVSGLRMDVRFIDDQAAVIDHFTILKGWDPCSPADLDGNGKLNFDDIDVFVAALLGADLLADCDGSGIADTADIDCFVSAFLAGCP